MINAYLGYSYQHIVTNLMIAIMDVNRKIESIEIEADIHSNFDDIYLTTNQNHYYFQIKDFSNISLNEIYMEENCVFLKGKKHILSKKINILFFKNIEIESNCNILGLPAKSYNGIFIISQNRDEILNRINSLYSKDVFRQTQINLFFNKRLDNRIFKIFKEDLPSINTFKTNLLEETVNIGINHLQLKDVIVLEGKPGVGKSHLVNVLEKKIPNTLVYRFWISNQDKEYENRLKFKNFLFDLSKILFRDLIERDEKKIQEEIKVQKKVFILDGLDHVENYNSNDLNLYLNFLKKLESQSSKFILLTRPIKVAIHWEKHIIPNWNRDQTEKVLEDLYHISKFDVKRKIFSITDGYPIVVRYVAEYYKKNNKVPSIENIKSIDNYYDQLLSKQVGKQALSIFLCSNSFYMESEFKMFLSEEYNLLVQEFISEHPYLFEIKLNRITLFHDSLRTYLREQSIDFSKVFKKVNQIVVGSILKEETRFLSRFNLFTLNKKARLEILKKYSCIKTYRTIANRTIDYEALRYFYNQIIQELNRISPNDLSINQYYELSLIANIVHRDHVSTDQSFQYTYIKTLLFNGYSEENITSSEFLFAMLNYIKMNDSILLYNLSSDNHFDTERFHEELQENVEFENTFFERQSESLSLKSILEILGRDDVLYFSQDVEYILINIFLHQSHKKELKSLHNCINYFLKNNYSNAYDILSDFLSDYAAGKYLIKSIIYKTKMTLQSLGVIEESSLYRKNNLKHLIETSKDIGSFDLWPKVHSYFRLSLHEKRKIDLSEIGILWQKYFQRKDYSFYGIPVALSFFEKNGLVHMESSIKLINEIQEVSEKGYRHLMNEYLELKPISVIGELQKKSLLDKLNILWFQLPSEYINECPDNIFDDCLYAMLRNNNSSQTVEYTDIKNVLNSNKRFQLINTLKVCDYLVSIKKDDINIKYIKECGLKTTYVSSDYHTDSRNSRDNFNNKILTIEDLEFIKKEIKNPAILAGFSDGYFASLSNLSIYSHFEKEKIQKNIKSILYNSILGKVGSHYSLPSLYYLPGNILGLISQFDIEVDKKSLFDSFHIFIIASLFDLPKIKL